MLCIRNRIAKISIITLSFSASLMNYTSQTGYSAKPNSIWAILQFVTPASKLHFLIGMGSWMTLCLTTEKILCEKPELTRKGCHAVSLLMCCCPNCQGILFSLSLIIQSSHVVLICQHSWRIIYVDSCPWTVFFLGHMLLFSPPSFIHLENRISFFIHLEKWDIFCQCRSICVI